MPLPILFVLENRPENPGTFDTIDEGLVFQG